MTMIPKGKARRNRASSNNRLKPGMIVEYQQHGNPIIAVLTEFSKKKWAILSEENKKLTLSSDRLYKLPASIPAPSWPETQKVAFLKQFAKKAEQKMGSVNLEQIWEKASEKRRPYHVEDLTKLAFNSENAICLLAVRRALFADRVFFKRKGIQFEPLGEKVVKERKEENEAREKEAKETEELIVAIGEKLQGKDAEMPAAVRDLEQLAVLGSKGEGSKRAKFVLSEVLKRFEKVLEGKPSEKSRQLLKEVGHFSENENFSLLRHARSRNFSDEILEFISSESFDADPVNERKDLREAYCITIDAKETKDMDDAISVEKTESGYRVGIHISDVASFIPDPENPLFQLSMERGSSVYCPEETVHMLPSDLAENKLSLVEGEDRRTVSFLVELDNQGEIKGYEIVRSLIKVDNRLDYGETNEILCNEENSADVSETTLLQLWDVASKREAARIAAGSLQFNRRDFVPYFVAENKIGLRPAIDDSAAFKLVGELMILANEVGAHHVAKAKAALLFRGQEHPEKNPVEEAEKIKEGPAREYFVRGLMKPSTISTECVPHSGLGLKSYAHITSPIRRTTDLINQIQLCSLLNSSEAKFSAEQLLKFNEDLQVPLGATQLIHNERNRYWMIKYFEQEGIKEFKGTIVRVDGPKPVAELEISLTTHPFMAVNKKFKERLGEEVELEVDQMDSQKEKFWLKEKGK